MKDYKEDGSKQAKTNKNFPRMRNGGAVNVCNRPGLGASKNDLSELHDEKMRNKRLRYHGPKYQTHRHWPGNGRYLARNGNIWPKGKVAGAHNDCATSVQYRKSA